VAHPEVIDYVELRDYISMGYVAGVFDQTEGGELIHKILDVIEVGHLLGVALVHLGRDIHVHLRP
jgi:hypothetical protein